MKTVLLLAFFGLIPCNSYAQSFTPEKLNKYTIGGYGVAAGVDIATTQYGLGARIVVEANPLQRYFTDHGPVVSGIVKSTMHAGIIYSMLRYKDKHPKVVFVYSLALLAGQVYVDAHNASVIRNAIQR